MRGLILAAVLACGGHVAAAATLPAGTDLFVFGDSLSDAGNIGPATNGQTWAGQLGALSSTTGGTNFAYGGAKAVTDGDAAPDFAAQRFEFLGALSAGAVSVGPDPLAVVWFGGNDLLNAGADPAAVNATIRAALTEIGEGAAFLSAFGLDRVILPNLPDLARIPANAGLLAAAKAQVTGVTQAFNAGLAGVAASLRDVGIDAEVFDTYALFDRIFADPGAFGFDQPLDGTCQRGAVSCDGYLFWDPIHPTAAAHALVADGIAAAVQPAPVPLPATLWLLAGALGGVAAFGRRRHAAA